MKILLLNPPGLDQSKYGKSFATSAFPSIGLSYLHSFLKQHNHKCKIYNFFNDSWDHIEEILRKKLADIVGIACFTEDRVNAIRLLFLIRKIKKNTIVIFGGHHSTYMYKQFLNNFDIDYIVLREGEKSFLNLIGAIEGKNDLQNVKGIAYKKNGVIITNDVEDYMDLDSLPFPISEEQLSIFKNYPSVKQIYNLEIKNFPGSEIFNNNPKGTIIITSRGCPFNCQFCSSTFFWGTKYRYRSSKNVVDEIEFYYNKFGFRFFRIADFSFTILPERSKQICKEIINRDLKIHFICQGRADNIGKDLVYWLKQAGCISVAIGVESGSSKILKEINKKITSKNIIKSFSLFREYNLPAYPLLMVGNPGETDETVEDTIKLLKIIKPYKLVVSITMVFPGTDLYTLSKKQGFIDDNYWLTQKPQPYYTFENSLKTLKKWQFKIFYYDKNKGQLSFIKLLYWLSAIFNSIFRKILIKNKQQSILNKIFSLLKAKVVVLVDLR